jgi:hypothetical protein
MTLLYRATTPIVLALWAATAFADGIDPGLWKVTTRSGTGGMIGPPQESSKCLTADQTHDLPTTFSPVPRTINSECAPIERSFADGKLTWRLVCKGQLDVELDGEFNFDSPHHYSGAVRTKAAMAGAQMGDSQNMIDAQWVSECP